MPSVRAKTLGKVLTTSSQDIYSIPNSFISNIDSIIISNITSSNVTFILQWYSSTDAVEYNVFYNSVLPANTTIQITDPLILRSGDKLKGLASANSSVNITIRVQEEYSVVN
jgi:hypothetical protein